MSCRYGWVFWTKKNSLKTGIKLSIEEVKADLKVKDVWFVKPGSSKTLLAAHTHPSVEVILPGTHIESTIMVDTFNDDASFYIVSS